jgi:hypothetical protein
MLVVVQLNKACFFCLAVRCALVLAVLLLVACAGNSAPKKSAPIVASPSAMAALERKQKIAQHKTEQLRHFLAYAQQALANDKLMLPAFDSAYYWYQQALAVDDLSAEAHWGMRQITARYLQLAEQAFSSGRIDEAERMLAGAGRVSATPKQLNDLRQRYRVKAADNEFYLSQEDLLARNGKIQQYLVALAEQAKASDSRLLIVARTDAEGRWIYKQMHTAVIGYRLRGNIELGRVPRVILIDL